MRRPALSTLLLFALALPFTAFAEPSAPPPDTAGEVPTLPTVTVVAAPEEHLTGRSVLDRAAIEALPGGDGSVNELLGVLPSIQFSEEARSGETGGEILPPEVSITGGKTFQNRFSIDGLGNDNLLDPASTAQASAVAPPGHSQELFLDSHLIEEIRVYDHNVPAEFGGFTGGAVDARTRNPAGEFGGSVHYRTTGDRWTEHHVDKEDEEAFATSRTHEQQPRFDKHYAGLSLDLPLSETAGLLASYQRAESRIPLVFLADKKTQERLLENYFLKYVHDLSPRDSLALTATYAPYAEERFYKDSLGGDYSIEGGGYSFGATYNHAFDGADLQLQAGYRRSGSAREGADHLTVWKVTESKDWGAAGANPEKSFEGSPGTLEAVQRTLQTKADLSFTEFATGPLHHALKVGGEHERIEGVLERPADWNFLVAMDTMVDLVDCPEGDGGCIDGEQYTYFRQVWGAGRVGATIDRYAFYVEDRMRLGRLEVRPGVRITYDDYMRNRDAAPRLAASLDVFGTGRTVLVAGANRYYGKTLLAYKLRELSRPATQTRFFFDFEWGEPKVGSGYRYSELKTPYADERLIGLDQEVLGGTARLRYIEREGNDEFAKEKDDESNSNVLNNNGHSRHREMRIDWERRWQKHYLAVNATYQKTRYSNESYSDTFDWEYLGQQVWYKGEYIDRAELPRRDFNRAWVGHLTYAVQLPLGFSFTNVTTFRSAYIDLGTLSRDEKEALGIPTDRLAYEREKKPESWRFDWRLAWEKQLARKQALRLTLEIENVFNQKAAVGTSDSASELGRQIWAGAEYRF